MALVMYINSTVLGQFVTTTRISALYALGAAGSIALLFYLPHIVKKIGLVQTSVGLFIMIALTLLTLGATTRAALFTTVFVLYSALSGIIWYCNDLFVAHYAKAVAMGHTRGAYLTINNTAIALMPIAAGILLQHFGYHLVYLVAALILCLSVITIVASQQNFVDREYTSIDIADAWSTVRRSAAMRRIVVSNFLLQFFYVWMVIYAPLYLITVLGFSWSSVGIAFTIMLLAFTVMQYPIGILADRIGEKKLLVTGFLIASISTIVFALHTNATHSIVFYTIILFCTRIGASMIEVLSESYFFKQVTDRDEGFISIYRMMYPLAYIIAPILGWYILSMTSYPALFVTLGAIMLGGALYLTRLVILN